jgi:SAM-dependent methyltransferase
MVVGDASMMPVKDHSVELALVFQVLGDVPDPSTVLAELSRVLKENGRIIVYETMAYPQHDMPHDYYRIMPQGLRYQAARASLEVNEVQHVGGLFSRFAVLWNNYVLNTMKKIRILRWIVPLLSGSSNLAFYAADRIFPRPTLSDSYVAFLSKGRKDRSPT